MSPKDSKRRRIRTRFQAFVAACGVLLVAVPVALDILEAAVSPEVYAVLAGAAGLITAVAGMVTRVMALPQVAVFIDRYAPWLSADEPPAEG